MDQLPELVKSALSAACNSGKSFSWKVQRDSNPAGLESWVRLYTLPPEEIPSECAPIGEGNALLNLAVLNPAMLSVNQVTLASRLKRKGFLF